MLKNVISFFTGFFHFTLIVLFFKKANSWHIHTSLGFDQQWPMGEAMSLYRFSRSLEKIRKVYK